MHFVKSLALLTVILVSGCVNTSSIPELPESLDGDGLLVGKIYMPGSARWTSSQVTINGRTHNASLRDGYLALRLAPGEYTLDNLRALGWYDKVSQSPVESPYVKVKGGGGYRAPTYTYSPGTTTVTHYTLLPINQKFRIEANRVTSIGMYVFLTDPKEPKKFYTIKLQNPKEITHFLDTNYPVLTTRLANRELLVAEAKYLDSAKLGELRQAIAAREAKAGHFYALKNSAVSYGDAGTVVILRTDPGRKKEAPPQLQTLDTGTLANIKQIQVQGERLSFLTADAQVLILENGQLQKRSIPFRTQPERFRRFGEQGILIVDNRRRLLTSRDDGLTWEKDESVLLDKATNQLDILADRDGAYIYGTRGIPDNILLKHYNQSLLMVIPGPPSGGRIPATSRALLKNTEAGLFIDYAARDFHFKPSGQADWQLRSAPADKCGLFTTDRSGRMLTITCDKLKYRSEDSGTNWTRQEPASPAPAS